MASSESSKSVAKKICVNFCLIFGILLYVFITSLMIWAAVYDNQLPNYSGCQESDSNCKEACKDDCKAFNDLFCCEIQSKNCWENATICNATCDGSDGGIACSYVPELYCCQKDNNAVLWASLAAVCCFYFIFMMVIPVVLCINYLHAKFVNCSCCNRCWETFKSWKDKPRSLSSVFRCKFSSNKNIEKDAKPTNKRSSPSDTTSVACTNCIFDQNSTNSCETNSVFTVGEDYALGTPVGGSPPPSYKSRTSICSNSGIDCISNQASMLSMEANSVSTINEDYALDTPDDGFPPASCKSSGSSKSIAVRF